MTTVDVDGEQAFIYIRDMPIGIDGHTVKNHDGSYSIFLNAKLSNDALYNTCLHELNHIRRGDLDKKDVTIQQIEFEAHTGIAAEQKIDPDIKEHIEVLRKERKRIRRRLAAYEKKRLEAEKYGINFEEMAWRQSENYGG